MRHRRIACWAVLLACLATGVGRGEVIARWEFPVGFPNGTGNIPTGTTYLPSNATSVGSTTGTFPVGTAGYPAGTPTYGVLAGSTSALLSLYHANGTTSYTSPAGNGSLYSFSANFWTAGDYWQVRMPTTGYTGLEVSWDQARSSTGPATFSLKMSTDGTTFTDVTSSYTPLVTSSTVTGTWASSSYNAAFTLNTGTLAGAATALVAAENQPSVWFRIVSATTPNSTGGTARIDNLQVVGVPEPTSIVAVIVGLGMGGVVAVRRRRERRRGV